MTDRKVPEELFYWIEDGKIVEHIWLRSEGDDFFIGLTEMGVELMGDIVSLSPNDIGTQLSAGNGVATIESSKWVGPVSSPIAGSIADINGVLAQNPASINSNPYDSWIVKIRIGKEGMPPSLVTGPEGARQYIQAASVEMEESA